LEEPTPKPTSAVVTIDPTFVCPGDGEYSYEQNCHYYYQCSNGNIYLRQCSADLVFYPPKKRCASLSEVDMDQLNSFCVVSG
jgi:hypothetical protein